MLVSEMDARELSDRLKDVSEIEKILAVAEATGAKDCYQQLSRILLRNVVEFGPLNPQNCSTVAILILARLFPNGGVNSIARDLFERGDLVPVTATSDIGIDASLARVCSFIVDHFEAAESISRKTRDGALIVNSYLRTSGWLTDPDEVMDI